jgi:hypothetical protein
MNTNRSLNTYLSIELISSYLSLVALAYYFLDYPILKSLIFAILTLIPLGFVLYRISRKWNANEEED